MKHPITANHHRKYSNLCALWGVAITTKTFLDLTRGEMLEKLWEDPHLNNVKTLNAWDHTAAYLVGKKQPYDSAGVFHAEYRGGASLGEAVCAMKHAAASWAGAEFVTVDWDDPSLRGAYPRRPEWG